MSDIDWWSKYTDTSSSTASSGYYMKYDTYRAYQNPEFDQEVAKKQIEEVKIDFDKFKDLYLNKPFEPPQFMRSILDDFKEQLEPEPKEEPQTIFHFDPKGIVEEWPENEN